MLFWKPRSSCEVCWWVGFLLVFALPRHLQVYGRPYEETIGTSDCFSLTLTHPKSEFLSKITSQLALDKELEGRTLLTVKNDSSFPWKSWRLCEVSGSGRSPRDKSVELMNCDSQFPDDDQDYHRIKGAAAMCGSEDAWDHGPAAFLLSQSHLKTLCQFESVELKVSCPDVLSCYRVSLKQDPVEISFRSRRILAYSSQDQHKTWTQDYGVLAIVGVVVGVAGVLLMFFVLFLCAGGGEKYEPSGKNQDKRARTVSGEVAETDSQVAIKESNLVKDPKTNGTSVTVSISVDTNEEPKSQESAEVHSHGSSDHDQHGRRSPSAENHPELSAEAEKRARALSAPRSFDPLPELPKLELAEDVIPEKAEDGKRESAEGEGDDDDDDDPYDVVPDNNPDRMSNHSNSESEGGSRSPERRQSENSSMPVPYGKVSRHAKPGEHVTDDENDSYAEVRDVMRQGPQVPRERSLTSPVHLDSPGSVVRDKRSHTESATHMPLPRIPPSSKRQPSVDEEDSVAYDSIRGEGAGKAGRISKSKLSGAAPTKRDQLYESVDEMGERDLYESVPDDLTKLDSPMHLAIPDASSFSPSKNPDGASAPPLPPPSSPAPLGEVKKRALEKALSSSANEEGKRRFSFFRKKTASVSAVKSKKGESSSDSPALANTSSPQHKSPPLPNIPVPQPPTNEDDDEDTYDKVTPGLPPGDNIFQQAVDDASKSKSLPMGYRSGVRSNLPLPKLPEDSGSATVVHKRVLEEGVPDEYDTVHHPPIDMIPDEPNYDSVELESRQLVYPKLEVDPPYDKVDKNQLQQELENAEGKGTGFDPPYDKVDQDKLNELREQEALKKETTASTEGESLSLGYSVVRGVTPEGERGKKEEPGPQPEHDEEGYAVVPAEFKMRKRAMSATRDAKKGKDNPLLSPDSVAAGYKVIEREGEEEAASLGSRSHTFSSPTKSPPQSLEEQYASVNLKSKREDRKRQELEEVLREQEALKAQGGEDIPRSVSPIPPPLPPAPNPDDLMDVEVEQPPIPPQMEGINEPEGEDENGLRVPSDNSDPPYARVRNKVDNPYAVVVNPPYTEIDVSNLTARIQGQGIKSETNKAAVEDEEAGYDVVGAAGTKLKAASSADAPSRDKPYDTVADAEQHHTRTQAQHLPSVNGAELAAAEDDEQAYDTIADLKEEIASNSRHQPDLPMLDTASESNIYDSLLPQSPPKSPTDQPPRSMV